MTNTCAICHCDPDAYGSTHQCEHTDASCAEHYHYNNTNGWSPSRPASTDTEMDALYLEQSNPNQPTPAKYCARCGYAPCLYAHAQNPEARPGGTMDLCRQLMPEPTTPANAAADLLTELEQSHPNLTRSDIRTLLRKYI